MTSAQASVCLRLRTNGDWGAGDPTCLRPAGKPCCRRLCPEKVERGLHLRNWQELDGLSTFLSCVILDKVFSISKVQFSGLQNRVSNSEDVL